MAITLELDDFWKDLIELLEVHNFILVAFGLSMKIILPDSEEFRLSWHYLQSGGAWHQIFLGEINVKEVGEELMKLIINRHKLPVKEIDLTLFVPSEAFTATKFTNVSRINKYVLRKGSKWKGIRWGIQISTIDKDFSFG